MRIRRILSALVLTLVVALGITVSAPNHALAQPQKNVVAGSSSPNFTYYNSGVVLTYNKWDTGVIGASSAFTPLWIAVASLNGQVGNKIQQSIWYIQAFAAYAGARGECLWVWVTYGGSEVSAGSYAC